MSERKEISPFKKIVNNLLVFGVPGPVEVMIDFPFIFTKNQLQTGGVLPPLFRANPKWNGAPSLLNIREYYRGMRITATGSFFSNYIMLNLNDILKKTAGVIDEEGQQIEGKQFQGAICSTLAGFAMSVFWNPIELSQVIQGQQKKNLIQASKDIYSRGRIGGKGPLSGILNFWTGFSGTALRDTLYTGMIFGISPYIEKFYDQNKYTRKCKENFPLFMKGISGITCGLFVGFITVPVDNCRTVIQSSCLNDHQLGFIEGVKNIYEGKVIYNATEKVFQNYLDVTLPNGEKTVYHTPKGVKGLFRGGSMRVTRVGMCGFIILFTRDFMRKMVNSKMKKNEI